MTYIYKCFIRREDREGVALSKIDFALPRNVFAVPEEKTWIKH
jgi:hypothetical protein